MNNEIITLVGTTAGSVSGIIGAVQMLKEVGLPKRLAPIAAIAVGGIGGFLAYQINPAAGAEAAQIGQGLGLGYVASSAYAGAGPTRDSAMAIISGLVSVLPFIGGKDGEKIAEQVRQVEQAAGQTERVTPAPAPVAEA